MPVISFGFAMASPNERAKIGRCWGRANQKAWLWETLTPGKEWQAVATLSQTGQGTLLLALVCARASKFRRKIGS
jgi:hypothetical protein